MTLQTAFILAAVLIPVGLAHTQPATTENSDTITAALPDIPDRSVKLTDFGGASDGKTLNTDAFTHAVAALMQQGGGHLIVPIGIYRTLPFLLASHIDLHLDAGAIIKAPDTFAEYGLSDPNDTHPTTTSQPSNARTRPPPLISCPRDSTDIAITGSGTIDGSGAIFWIWSDKAARRYPPGRTVVPRPVLVSLVGVKRLHVDGITLTNSPMFHLVPRGQDITIENIRIVAPSDAPNTDAIDPSGQRIVIRHCEIDTGDDDVALGSGTRDVLIEDLTCLHGHGISIGSGTRGGLSHIRVRRCTFDGTDNGLRIKSYRGNGGEVHDIVYEDIQMKNVRRPFDINLRYNGNANTNVDIGPVDQGAGKDSIPKVYDIHVRGLTVQRSPMAGRIIGLPENLPTDITFDDATFDTTRGFYVESASDVTFRNSTIAAATGADVVSQSGSVVLNGLVTKGDGDAAPFYAGN